MFLFCFLPVATFASCHKQHGESGDINRCASGKYVQGFCWAMNGSGCCQNGDCSLELECCDSADVSPDHYHCYYAYGSYGEDVSCREDSDDIVYGICATSKNGQCARFLKETSEKYDIEVPEAMTRKNWDVIGICCDSENMLEYGFCDYKGTQNINHARCPAGQVVTSICASDGKNGNKKCKDTFFIPIFTITCTNGGNNGNKKCKDTLGNQYHHAVNCC